MATIIVSFEMADTSEVIPLQPKLKELDQLYFEEKKRMSHQLQVLLTTMMGVSEKGTEKNEKRGKIAQKASLSVMLEGADKEGVARLEVECAKMGAQVEGECFGVQRNCACVSCVSLVVLLSCIQLLMLLLRSAIFLRAWRDVWLSWNGSPDSWSRYVVRLCALCGCVHSTIEEEIACACACACACFFFRVSLIASVDLFLSSFFLQQTEASSTDPVSSADLREQFDDLVASLLEEEEEKGECVTE